MKPVQTLPASYLESGAFDIKQNWLLNLALNLAGLALLIVFGWLFLQAVAALRPGTIRFPGQIMISFDSLPALLGWIGAVLALSAFQVILHEAIHGVFFWIYTRSRPKFALRLTYAYAAAPGWYLPHGQFLATTLAPLVVISLAGLASIPLLPPGWVTPVWYILTLNAAGSVGDMAVSLWLLFKPSTALLQDRGDVVTLYTESS